MVENTDDLALIITLECGKPLVEAKGELGYAASFVKFYAEEARRIYGETIPSANKNARILVTKQPIGVVAAITPWNFPAAMITRKLAPALAAGCTCVCKPAEDTPLTALALGVLAMEAGMPKGVLNILTGNPIEIGEVLTTHPDVRLVTFTGSTEVGKLLMRQSASTVKKVDLELGGNAPFIVFDDADIDKAVTGLMASKFRNAGQTCVCANRIFIQDGIYDSFAAKLVEAVGNLKVGDGREEGVSQGPLINQAGLEKVESHVNDAVEKGAQILCGGSRHERGGNYYEPTVLSGVSDDAQFGTQETFGPVAPLYRFSTEEDVIKKANSTQSGLASYFYTRDIGRVWRVAEALEFGMVGINEGIISSEVTPFGGVKQSGLGREGSHHGIEEFLEKKYMLMAGLEK